MRWNQKSEIFHCYNGSGVASVVADGLMAKHNDHFGDHQGCEKSRSRNLVLEPKLRLYEALRGRNTCQTSIFQPRELILRCSALGFSLAGPISPLVGSDA